MTSIVRKRGDTYSDVYTLKSKSTKSAINITGYSFILTLDPHQNPIDASNNVYQIVGIITDVINGIVSFSPTDAQVNLIGEYFYDVQMIDGASKKRTIDSGTYIFTQDITKN